MRTIQITTARELKKYSALRKEFLAWHPVCEVGSVKCTGKSEQVHHSKGREGANYLDVSTWIATCPACHAFIERDPECIRWAKEKGFVKLRVNDDRN